MQATDNLTARETGGLSFWSLLQVALIVLKLCCASDWSWWWILAPTWIPIAALGGIALVAGLVYLVAIGLEARRQRRRLRTARPRPPRQSFAERGYPDPDYARPAPPPAPPRPIRPAEFPDPRP